MKDRRNNPDRKRSSDDRRPPRPARHKDETSPRDTSSRKRYDGDDDKPRQYAHSSTRKPFVKKPFFVKKQASESQEDAQTETSEDTRLNKYISNAGICARRKADEHIKAGLVKVDEQTILEPGYRVKHGQKVTFKGEVVRPNVEKVYILLNTPVDVITTTGDPQGRTTVMDIVKKATSHRVYPVGRLDRDTMGLLLLTNDGDLAKKLSHPSHGVKKIYYVMLDRAFEESDFQKVVQRRVILEDGLALVDGFEYVKGGDATELGIEIHIGKNRFIRRLFEHLGYRVKKLDRVYYGGLTKKDLPRGKFRHLTKEEIVMLKHYK